MSLDFSTAPREQSPPPSLTFEQVKAALKPRALELCRHLIPGGRVESGEYRTADLSGGKGKSLGVNLAKGVWRDFADASRPGGDLISLWAAVHGCDPVTAKDQAAEWAGQRALTPQTWPAPAKPAPEPQDRRLGPNDVVYRYETPDGQPYLDVVRTPDKAFIQWTPLPDGKFLKGAPPPPRHLYNLRFVIAAAPDQAIVIVEGEKKVHALAEVGIVATTCVGGNSGVKMADWSPLAGKRVVIWRDHDEPGVKHAQAVEAELAKHGATLLGSVAIPADKPAKWDAADATPDERRQLVEAVIAQAPKPTPVFNPDEWDMTKYAGEPSPIRYLVAERMGLGLAGTVAAMGDTGKSMMLLDLALTIATCSPKDAESVDPPKAFGGRVLEFGTAVILGAEDAQDTIKRRLKGLDPTGARRHGMDPKRLRIIPFPNAGGVLPLIQQKRDLIETTERFTVLRKWLKTLPDLKLIVIDPLASFVQAALDNDNAAGAFVMGVFSAVAAETGACLVCAHHVRKADGEITNVAEARAQVRGASSIVDNGRFCYVLWPAPEQQAEQVCKRLEIQPSPNTVVRGAIVKANDPADRTISLFVRDPASGLLIDKTEREKAKRAEHDESLVAELVGAIAKLYAGSGRKPVSATGKNGLDQRREDLGPAFDGVGKGKLAHILKLALEQGKLVRGDDGFLHVPR